MANPFAGPGKREVQKYYEKSLLDRDDLARDIICAASDLAAECAQAHYAPSGSEEYRQVTGKMARLYPLMRLWLYLGECEGYRTLEAFSEGVAHMADYFENRASGGSRVTFLEEDDDGGCW